MMLPRSSQLLCFVAALLLAPSFAAAQIPQTRLNAVSPPGGQAGQTIDVTISSGQDLDFVDRMLFSHPGITASPKMQEQGGKQVPVTNAFVVTIANNVPVGQYEVRAQGYFGVSNPRTFVVGDRPEIMEQEANNTPEAAQQADLGTVVNGVCNGTADVDFYKFTVPDKQRIILTAEAQRIDSRAQIQLELYNTSGRRLERSRGGYRGDPVLDYTVPGAGEYLLRVTEFSYRGGNDYFYRLHLNTGPHLDFVLPPSGLPGSNGPYTIYGRNLPGGKPSGVKLDGAELEMLTTNIKLPNADQPLPLDENVSPEESSVPAFSYRLKSPNGTSNAISIHLADAPVVLEKEPNNDAKQAQKITVPTEVGGQFQERLDADWFEFTAKAGEVYGIEVCGNRLGKATDPRYILEQVTVNDKGEEQVKRITDQDDQKNSIGGDDFNTRHRDPVWLFTVPADGTYRLMLHDRYRENRGHPNLVYRLVIRKQTLDYRLVAFASTPNPAANQPGNPGVLALRKGDNAYIDVLAHRQDGFNGTIEVRVEGLPAGVTCPGAVIGPGDNSARLILTAAPNAQPVTSEIRVVGESLIEDPQKQKELTTAVAAIKPAEDKLPNLQKAVEQAMPKVQQAQEMLEATRKTAEEANKKAVEAQKKADAEQKAAEAKVKAATDALTKAQNEQKASQAALTKQQKALETAQAGVKAKEAELKTAQETLQKAKAEAEKDKENQDKAKAVTAAEQAVKKLNEELTNLKKAVDAETAKLTAAQNDLKAKTDAVTKADAEKKTADTALATAKETKTKADAAAKAADENLKKQVAQAEDALKKTQEELKKTQDALTAGQQEVANAKKRVNDLQTQLQQTAKKVTHPAQTASLIWPASTNTGEETDARLTRNLMVSVMDDVAEFQTTVALPQPRFEVSQSSQVLVPVKVERREGFANNVNLTFAGFDARRSKLQVENKPLNKDETEGVRRIFIPKDSPPGAYTIYLNSQAQVSFERNPKAIAEAKQAQDDAEAKRKAAEEANKKAVAAQQKADADQKAAEAKAKAATDALTNAQNAQKAAQTAVTNQQKALATAQANHTAKETALKTAQETLKKTVEAQKKADAEQKAAEAKVKAATDALAKAQNEQKASQAALTKQQKALETAQAGVKAKEAELKTAQETLQKAKAEADKDKENQDKAKAVIAAEQAVKKLNEELTNLKKAVDAETAKLTAAQNDLKAKTDAVANADAQKKTSDTALATAKETKTKADAAAKAAEQEVQKLTGELANLKKAVDAETAKLTAAQADLKTKTDAVTKADAEKKAAETALAAAKEAKTKADAEAKTADAAFKSATTAKSNADKNLQNVTNANKAKNVNLTVPSTPVVLIVKDAPFELAAAPPNGGNLKKGQAIEIKVTVKRVPRFDGPVQITLPLPPGVSGLRADPLTIPPDQTEGILKVHADGNAPDGKPNYLVIRGTANFLGKASVDAPLSLNITK